MASNVWGKVAVAFLLLPVFYMFYLIGQNQAPTVVMVKEDHPQNVQYVTHSDTDRHTGQVGAGSVNSGMIPGIVMPPNSRLANHVILEYDLQLKDEFQRLVDSKVKPDDPSLLKVIRRMLDPPSQAMVKMSRQLFETPQSKAAMEILHGMKEGFFIEAGANDGERASNTIWLEQTKGWTGLLIEPDPYFYTQVMGKSRRAWGINACLSPDPHPTIMDFKESKGGMGTLVDEKSPARDKTGKIRKIPCLPLKSLLLALNQTTVDFFSLDVEGFELPILKTVPWEEVNVRTLAVEYAHGRGGKAAYKSYMEQQGYTVHKDIHFHDPSQTIFVDDFIFKKKNIADS